VTGVATIAKLHGVDGVQGVMALRVPGALAFRNVAIRVVSTACKMALEGDAGGGGGEGDDFEAEVVSAFGEAFNNIAIHGYRGLAPEPVHIEVDWDEEKIVITAIDTGHIFDPKLVAVPDLEQLHERGMGLFIMRSCMDAVEYRPGPPNVLRLVKLRTRREGMLPPPPASHGDAGPPSSPSSQDASFLDAAGSNACPSTLRGPSSGDRGSGVQRVGGSSDQVTEDSRRA
jgi:serine/threonine-protein kinase RsbW